MRQTHPNLSERWHRRLQDMLEARGAEIRARLRALREAPPDEPGEVRDAEDQSVADFLQALELALLELHATTATRIQDSLARLAAGSYGLCGDCGCRIPVARLRALPFAERCRACQESVEARAEEETGRARGTTGLAALADVRP